MRLHITLCFLSGMLSLQAGPVDQWVWRNRLPCSPGFWSVAHGAGLWIAAPQQSGVFIATSPDGANWDATTVGTNTIFSLCAYGNGVFVVGTSRGAWVCTNAHNWFRAPGTETFDQLMFGNGWFVGCDVGGSKIWRSPDGTNWTSSSLFVNPLNCLCFANGKFFEVGGTGVQSLYVSTDGLNWSSSINAGTNVIQKIAYGNGRYVGINNSNATAIFSEFRVSADGTNWGAATRVTNTAVQDVIFLSNRFLALDLAGGIMRSTDGTNWTEDLHSELFGQSRLDFDGKTYVAVGPIGNIVTSPDSTNWTLRTVGPLDTLLGISYVNNTFIATGGNQIENLSQPSTIVTSKDGRTWIRRDPGTTNWLMAATYGNGRYVAVGTNGAIVTSTDATNWSAASSPITDQLSGVAYGAGQFVAVGGTAVAGRLLTSPDGLSWTQQPAPFNALYAILFAGGKFVAVGQSNSVTKLSTIFTSPDGLNWTFGTAATTNNLRAIAYGNGVYVAAGDRGQIGVSGDGLNWTNVSLNTTTPWRGVAYGGGQFLLMLQSPLNWAVSTNGTNWTISNTIRNFTPGLIEAVTAGPNSFFIAGYLGLIMESGPFVPPPMQIGLGMLQGNPPVISISAPEFHGYEVQASDGLQSAWTPLGSVSNYSAVTHLPVPAASNSNTRLYRVRSLD